MSAPAMAQIVLDETFLTGRIGQTVSIVEYSATDLTGGDAILAASGTNQTWDFTMASYEESFSGTQTMNTFPGDFPRSDDPAFAGTDFVIATEVDTATIYLYQSLDAGTLAGLGNVFVGDFDENGTLDTLASTFSPPTVGYQFPLQFGASWDDSTSLSLDGSLPFNYILTEAEVDGWGMLVTPEGSEPALRIKSTMNTFLIGVPIGSESVDYEFLTAGGTVARLTTDVGGSVSSMSYSVVGEPVDTAIEPEGMGIPETFQLSQNFPNPFNPSTSIRFSLPEASFVNLTVYTLTGKAVATLVDGTQPAGSYSVSFDASNLSSGIYLYRLQTDRNTLTRKMTLLK